VPALSFVIPTHNRASILVQCLRAVADQDDPSVEYEIVVVDDGSSDETQAAVQALIPSLACPVTVLRQDNAGPATARNLGVSAATGQLIAFLGDDIVVARSYVRSLYQCYQRAGDELRGVLGFTRYREDCVPTPFGRWLDTDSGFQFEFRAAEEDVPLAFDQFYTSNVLLARTTFERAGGFDERLRHAAFEDTELGNRLAQLGFSLHFCPQAQAVHVHPVSVQATRARMKMIARALNDLQHINPELFARLYPEADTVFGHPSTARRAVRRLFSGPVAQAVQQFDRRGIALPGALYARVLRSTFSREMSSRWSGRDGTMNGT
jgi:glycosyltransferase involved in cell wall biosynthesis